MDITTIIEAVIALIFAILTVVVIPYLKGKMTAEGFHEMVRVVGILVHAAEQIFGSGKGAEKKQYVLEALRGYGYNFDEKILSDLIESAVLDMNKELKD